MLKFSLLLTLALLFALALGQSTVQARQLSQDDTQLTQADLANAEYRSQYTPTRTVRLTDGVYEDDETGLRIVLTTDYALGDLNNDKVADAAAILTATVNDSAPYYNLVALTNQEGQPAIGGLIMLGEDIHINKLTIANGKISLDYLRPQPGDPAGSPSRQVTQSFFSRRGLLVPEQTKSFGQLFPYPVGNLYGYMNVLGEMVLEPQFALAGDFTEGLAPVSYDGRTTGFINQVGELIISPRFSYAGNFVHGLAIAGLPGVDADVPFLTVYIDRLGRLVFGDQRFRAAEPFSEGLAAVSYAGQSYGYINLRGEIVIEPQFDQAEPFSEGLAPVQLAGQYGFIDRSGKLIIPPQYEAAEPFNNGLAQVVIGGKTGYINQRGEVVIEPIWDYGNDFSEGRALVARDSQLFYIDESGTIAIELPGMTRGSDFAEGLAAVAVEDRYGYIDLQGNLVIPPQFSAASNFKNGLAVVETAEAWSLMNSIGEVVSEVQRFTAVADSETELIEFTPAVPQTVRPGTCSANSAVVALPSAWQCKTADQSYDPCFTAVDGQSIVCDAAPAVDQPGFVVELSKPLPKPAAAAKKFAPPLWQVQLSDGAICTHVTGLELVVDEQRVNYTCSDNTVLLGAFITDTARWQVNKVTLVNNEQGVYSTANATLAEVVKVWQPVEP